MDRPIILLMCGKCKRKNYSTHKSGKKNASVKLKLKKYCSSCRAHTVHKETKT